MEKAIEPYLPSPEALESMNLNHFGSWIMEAEDILIMRDMQRNPLLHLKERIAGVLREPDLSEEQREKRVLGEIRRFNRQAIR